MVLPGLAHRDEALDKLFLTAFEQTEIRHAVLFATQINIAACVQQIQGKASKHKKSASAGDQSSA